VKSRAICTAIVVRGAVTQRVDRVIRATPEARKLIAEAESIRRERAIGDNRRRLGLCEPHPASRARPFRVISISIYCDELQRLDAMVAAARRSGKASMSRSRMIRSAIKAIAPMDGTP
jgi:hypothetical protein